MEFTVLVHIVLGSILTIGIILTGYNLLRTAMAPADKRALFVAGARRSAIWTVALFVVYFVWIWVKRSFL